MVEYGNAVSQGTQAAGHGGGGGTTDLGTMLSSSFSDALNHAAATIGVPPALLAAVAAMVVLFVLWRVFAR